MHINQEDNFWANTFFKLLKPSPMFFLNADASLTASNFYFFTVDFSSVIAYVVGKVA